MSTRGSPADVAPSVASPETPSPGAPTVAVVLVVESGAAGPLQERLQEACPACEVRAVTAKDDVDTVVADTTRIVQDAGRPSGSAAAMLADLADVPYADAKRQLVELFDSTYTGELLRRTGGNLSEAARRAGLDRSNFRRLLKRHRRDP